MKPLNGIRILSIEQFGAGPYGSMFLADLGAEVIKVENKTIGGDPARRTGPFLLGEDDSLYFQVWHSNKQSVTLDLKSAEGRAAFDELVGSADAVINNLRGDLPARMGLDYATLGQIKPAIVCLHISAYGRDTTRTTWPGYDYLMQAEAGLMDLTGEPDGPPSRLGGPSIIDHMTGITGAVGLLACLLGARTSGKGCDVDCSLFDVALHQLGYAATWYLNEGHVSKRMPRSAHFSIAPVQTFPTADGWVFVMCMTQKFWEILVDTMDRPDLKADERFATPAARTTHRAELSAALDAAFRGHATAWWLDRLGSRLPIAPVFTLGEALENPFLEEAGMLNELDHPHKPGMRVLANPLKVDGKRLEQTIGSALGADNGVLPGPSPIRAVG